MSRYRVAFPTVGLAGGVAAGLMLSLSSFASDKPEIKWGGKIYAHYGYILSEEAEKYNEFDIDRVYLTAKAKLDSSLSVRVTTDVGRVEDSEDEKLRLFLKYAYLEWAASDAFKLRLGSAGTGFVGFYDKFWGQRYLAKSFTDDNKILDSADIGVHALGEMADGLVTWQASIVNGEGYGSAETSATKAAQARLTVDPMASSDNSLPITVFASQDVMAPDSETPVRVLAGAAGYKMDHLTFWGEYVLQSAGETSGSGYSVTLVPKIPEVLNVIARYDHWDPNADADGDSETTIRAGVSRDFLKKVSGALTYERTTVESDKDTPEHGVFLRMQAGF